jgi:molybdenum cofactor cytidylyltransferase
VKSAAVVPAAGKAERFGGAKLVADVGGEPLLDRTLSSLLDAGVDRVVVVIAPGAADSLRRSLRRVSDERVAIVENPDPGRGMFSSIQTGLAAADADCLLILPGDMPFVRPETVAAVLVECRITDAVVTPRHLGRRGHPVALPGRLRGLVLSASGTLSDVLKMDGIDRVDVEVDDPGVLRDVDEPRDLDGS